MVVSTHAQFGKGGDLPGADHARDDSAAVTGTDGIPPPQDGVIQLVEETVRIDKRTVKTGNVRVRTVVDEEPVVVRATLSGNYVTVDRIAVNRVVDAVPPPREVDGVMIISVVEERLRVVRELVLIEEVHMRDVQTSEPFEETITRRVMRAEIEREHIDRETA